MEFGGTLMPGREEQIKGVGRCCDNELKYTALINNFPLTNFTVSLCSVHASDRKFTQNAIKITEIE